jgi:lysophospholipase L1-like esterase
MVRGYRWLGTGRKRGRRRRRRALIGLLGISLVLCAPRSWAADQFAGEIEAFAKADRQNPPGPCHTLFVGSSSIRFWDSLTADMGARAVINRGFGGAQISDVNHYFDAVVRPYRPQAIVFYAGDNDIAAGKSPQSVVDDFQSFMALKTQALGATPVYFISIKPSKLRLAQLPLQARANAAIRAMARARQDLDFIDVVPEMLDNGVPKDLFRKDGLHMTAKGYAIWAGAVNEALARDRVSRSPSC